MRCRLDPQVRKNLWSRAWQPTPVFLSGESHGQGSLADYSPWGHKESDTTGATSHAWTQRLLAVSTFLTGDVESALVRIFILKNVRGYDNQEKKTNKHINQRVASKCSKILYDIGYMWKLKKYKLENIRKKADSQMYTTILSSGFQLVGLWREEKFCNNYKWKIIIKNCIKKTIEMVKSSKGGNKIQAIKSFNRPCFQGQYSIEQLCLWSQILIGRQEKSH